MEKKDICSYTYEELQEEVENLQEKVSGRNRFTSGCM